METIIVILDDAGYALHHLQPMAREGSAPAHWVLVACPPRMTRHASKWVHRAAREAWRGKWCAELFAQVEPQLEGRGHRVTTHEAHKPLVDCVRELVAQHGAARVLDARRPKFGQPMEAATPGQPDRDASWQVPGAVAGLGAMLVLAAD